MYSILWALLSHSLCVEIISSLSFFSYLSPGRIHETWHLSFFFYHLYFYDCLKVKFCVRNGQPYLTSFCCKYKAGKKHFWQFVVGLLFCAWRLKNSLWLKFDLIIFIFLYIFVSKLCHRVDTWQHCSSKKQLLQIINILHPKKKSNVNRMTFKKVKSQFEFFYFGKFQIKCFLVPFTSSFSLFSLLC